MRYGLTALIATLISTSALAADVPAKVRIDLKNSSGAMVGSATLTEAPNGVLAHIEVKGLPPGWHGLHFHETGDCSKADFTSAGGHVHAMTIKVHGLLNPDINEAGDLPNLYVAADGSGAVELLSTFVSLNGAGTRPALADKDGSALVIHASPDDYRTQPIGGAGARIACAAIPGH
jgi:Cu-Zn family superoxide dismutase